VAVLFGREDNGLSNEELMRCNLHLAIPTSDAYSSLNLAMAVQIVSYELHMLGCIRGPAGEPDAHLGCAAGDAGQHGALLRASRGDAQQIGFLNPAAPRQLMRACAASTVASVSTRWN
jgi:tRNA (cytidine32/uridine32-2'-O)-methyltransferase